MRKVFVDTAAWIALINISDDLHIPAQQVMSALRQLGLWTKWLLGG